MSRSKRLLALKALTSHLEKITKANGYQHDLSANVFRGRSVFGADDPTPLISILESPRSDIGTFGGDNERIDQLVLLVQGWVSDDIDNPTDPAYELMEDVESHLKRLTTRSTINGEPNFPDDYLLGRLVGDVKVQPGVVRPPMEGVSSKAFFYLPVTLTLVN